MSLPGHTDTYEANYMAALPPTRQIQFGQIPGAPSWFAGFLQALNAVLGPLYDIANAGTTFGDNIPGTYKTLQVSTPLSASTPLTFKNTNKAAPQAVTIAQCTLTHGTPTVFASDGTNIAIGLNQWSYSGGNIQLDSLVGLQPNCTYSIKFLTI